MTPNRTIPSPPYCPACMGPEVRISPLFDAGHKLEPPPKGHAYFNSNCHPESGLLAEFCREHNTVTLVCRKCSRTAGCFLIATTLTYPVED